MCVCILLTKRSYYQCIPSFIKLAIYFFSLFLVHANYFSMLGYQVSVVRLIHFLFGELKGMRRVCSNNGPPIDKELARPSKTIVLLVAGNAR